MTIDAWIDGLSFRGERRSNGKSKRFGASSLSSSPMPPPIETMHGQWNVTSFAATQCWGRRPLLMRNAFDPSGFPSWEDIFDLACAGEEEDEPATTRLIQHKPGTLDSYQVEFGPFLPEDLKESLRQRTDNNNENFGMASTLVVNDVDRLIPDVSDWMDSHFDFLPRWRRDDAQVSLAPTGGGIGPHVDNYDVFLIQASGSREWEVGCGDVISVHEEFTNLVEESQVRVLNMTVPTFKMELQKGDCLYLPPRVLHFGTSTSDECITLSVGCRTPSAADLLARIAESTITSTSSAAVERYTDINLLESTNDKSLSVSVKEKMKRLLLQLVEDFTEDEVLWDDMIGKLITESNRPTIGYPIPMRDMDGEWKEELGKWANPDATLESVFGGTGVLRRAEGISFAWSALPSSSVKYRLYAQGRVFKVDDDAPSTPSLLCRIANGPPLDKAGIQQLNIMLSPKIRKFLHTLLEEGFIYGDDEMK